jgi:hypothetical protein
MFKESLFHSYVAGIPWGEYLRKSVELYNEKSNTEPETKETKERAEKFDDFYRQKTKRQVIKVKNLENNK